MQGLTEFAIERFERGVWSALNDVAVAERQISIRVNDQAFLSTMATPERLDDLAVGLLFGESAIERFDELASIAVDEEKGRVDVATKRAVSLPDAVVRTSGFGAGMASGGFLVRELPTLRDNPLRFRPEDVSAWMEAFDERSQLFRETGAVHSCCLVCGEERFFAEDVGRHNALDKVIGSALRASAAFPCAVLLTTGRVSTEILRKTARAGVCALFSRSAPTDASIELARRLGVTLVGFARGNRFNVYAGTWRLRDGE